MMELPIYRDYFQTYLKIIIKLEELKQNNSKHLFLIQETYKVLIQIFPTLNAGYNYWGRNEKIKLYNKVRILLSQLQSYLNFLSELNLISEDYSEDIENSTKYIGGLIRKIENPNEIK